MGIPHFFMTSRVWGIPGRFLLSFFKEMKNKNKVVSNRCNVPRSSKGRFFGLLFLPLWDFTCNFSIERRFFPRQNRPFRLKGIFPRQKRPLRLKDVFWGMFFYPMGFYM